MSDLHIIANLHPKCIRVFGNGTVEVPDLGRCFTPVALSVSQVKTWLEAEGYVRRDCGAGYCAMSVFTWEREAA